MAALVSEGMGAVIPSHRFIGFAAAKAGTKTSPQTPPWAHGLFFRGDTYMSAAHLQCTIAPLNATVRTRE